MEPMRPTPATSVQPPVSMPEAEVVSLMFLRDAEGEPVNVLVSPVGELELIDLLGALPGQQDPEGLEGSQPGLGGVWTQFAPIASQIIEKACTPRFSFAEVPPEGSLPGAWLRDSEKLGLVLTALRVSGWTGGAAELAASFLRQRAERASREAGEPGDGGSGAVDAGPLDGTLPERAVPSANGVELGSDAGARLQPDRDALGTKGARRRAGSRAQSGAVG